MHSILCNLLWKTLFAVIDYGTTLAIFPVICYLVLYVNWRSHLLIVPNRKESSGFRWKCNFYGYHFIPVFPWIRVCMVLSEQKAIYVSLLFPCFILAVEVSYNSFKTTLSLINWIFCTFISLNFYLSVFHPALFF